MACSSPRRRPDRRGRAVGLRDVLHRGRRVVQVHPLLVANCCPRPGRRGRPRCGSTAPSGTGLGSRARVVPPSGSCRPTCPARVVRMMRPSGNWSSRSAAEIRWRRDPHPLVVREHGRAGVPEVVSDRPVAHFMAPRDGRRHRGVRGYPAPGSRPGAERRRGAALSRSWTTSGRRRSAVPLAAVVVAGLPRRPWPGRAGWPGRCRGVGRRSRRGSKSSSGSDSPAS